MPVGIVFAGYVLTVGWADGLLYTFLLISHIHSLVLSTKMRAVWKEIWHKLTVWGSVGQIAERRNLKESFLLSLKAVALGSYIEFERPSVINPWKENNHGVRDYCSV